MISLPLTQDQSNWAVVIALALPHLLYAFIWFFPQQWLQTFKSKAVDVFASVAVALKGTFTLYSLNNFDHLADHDIKTHLFLPLNPYSSPV